MTLRTIGLILAALWAAAPAAAQHSTREMREMPPREVKRVLRDDLLSILALPGEVIRGNRRQLGDTAIPTRPVGSGIKGLCQRDLLLLFYAPTRAARVVPEERGELGEETGGETLEDVPVRPYAIEAERRFFFRQKPLRDEADDDLRFRSIFAEDCGGSADSTWQGWFVAPSAEDAVGGYFALQAAAAAVASGRVALSGCEEDRAEGVERCRSDLAGIAADTKSLSAIRFCPAESATLCYVVEAGMTAITIRLRASSAAPSADDVLSVAHETYIVVT